MLTFLYIIQFIIAFLLIFFIFFQKREETTSLLSSNHYNSMFKSTAVPSNPLIKIILVIGVLFFLNSIFISAILLKKSKTPSTLINKIEKYNTERGINIPTTEGKSSLPNTKSSKSKSSLPAVPLGNIN